jgi:hypothetical protein
VRWWQVGLQRRSCRCLAEAVYCDLVERCAFEAIGFALVVSAAAILQALERLAFLGRVAQACETLLQSAIVKFEIVAAGGAEFFHPFDEGLVPEQLVGSAGLGTALSSLCLLERLLGLAQFVGAALAQHHRVGDFLAGEILMLLAECANAFEAKSERGTRCHSQVVGSG